MSTTLHPSPTSLQQLVDQIVMSRRLTRTDQHRFMAIALSKGLLTAEEQHQINRVFDALRRGVLRVVD